MKNIRDLGGMVLTLDFGMDFIHKVIAISVIQFITEDCKVNDLSCGSKGSHSLDMIGLCNDCGITFLPGIIRALVKK